MGAPAPGQKHTSLAFGMTLAELLHFLSWLEKADKALARGEPLPNAPAIGAGTARGWADSIRRLDESYWRAQAQYRALEETVRAQEKPLRSFASNLCENLAALYERLGHREKAQAVRMRAAALHIS